ncbi:MAG: dockerin type I repeat-containing protein, partial [candidate division Zixibacteria bacterium]|nr:dockerin type I repeat-containing protein [candidate division Zixibacteria bacterium]
ILLLGFWQEIPGNPPYCTRIGGHYVTVAGVCTTTTRICISDPFFDHNEGEPPAGSAHVSAIHNDARLVSGPHGTIHHDIYNVAPGQFTCLTPIPLPLELTDYPDNFSDIIQFEQMNQPMMPPIVGAPVQGLPVHTMLEWVVMVCPKQSPCDCKPGDANGDATIDISDAVYLISYIFSGGLAPIPYAICSGDANCDCAVDISDAVYLIAYIFSGGAAPCNCQQWLTQCGPPLRK